MGPAGRKCTRQPIDTHQPAREGSGIFIRRQTVRHRGRGPGKRPGGLRSGEREVAGAAGIDLVVRVELAAETDDTDRLADGETGDVDARLDVDKDLHRTRAVIDQEDEAEWQVVR